jgi:hypothetical protein
MANCPLYNGQNLDFTGDKNPYGLIQKAGKKRSKKSMRKRGKSKRTRKVRKTRKYRR